jgi:hypothetical protein
MEYKKATAGPLAHPIEGDISHHCGLADERSDPHENSVIFSLFFFFFFFSSTNATVVIADRQTINLVQTSSYEAFLINLFESSFPSGLHFIRPITTEGKREFFF